MTLLSTNAVDRRVLPPGKRKGSAILATLCFAAVLSLSLSSYLAVCYRSLYLSNRDLQSSRSIQLAETGMEEAIWSLTNSNWTGWTLSGGNATKTMGGFTFENGTSGQVTLSVINYGVTTASFTATTTPQVTLTAAGRITLADGSTVTRTLQSTARPAQLFTNAIGATGDLAFTSGGVIDSYDSSIGAYSAPDPAHLTAGNSTAVVSGATVDLANAQIYGFATTDGTVLQNQSSARVIGPNTPVGTSIDPSRISTASNQPVFDLVTPGGGTTVYDPYGDATLTHSFSLNSPGVYRFYSINLENSAVLTISAANVVLVVTDRLRTRDSGGINVLSGASLQVFIENNTNQYDSRRQLDLQGAGIINASQSPQNVSIVGLGHSDANSRLAQANPFFGTVYLPNDNLDVSNNSTVYGALIGKRVTFTSAYPLGGTTPMFHYDTALRRIGISGVSTPFSLVMLREI
jgi:hypothetical protein